ncbi:MAG: tetratricopeptide repeat protein [Bacteroidales bacterium]|nr:tetratricopeptide repeat protein [Bacteroidales bacterium]
MMKRLPVKSQFMPIVLVIIAMIALCACNARKKNTAAARQYTAFITRYNIHYNGDKHYKETLEDMERNYEDDYSQLVLLHPAEAKANPKAPQPQGDFTRSIEKAQKAIQLRSITKKPARKRGRSNDPAYKAWLKRDEYNPFLHNDWLMMGRSQYMNGDFLGAAATFFYTSRHFSWLPATVTEARLWQARSYLAQDWLFEAESIITRIKPDELTNKTLKQLYNLDFAELRIKEEKFAEAIPYLEEATRLSSGAQKTRLQFLLGQIYERNGNKELAYKMFGKAAGANSASYRTKFNARIKQSEVFTGTNIEPEIKALRRMTRYDRNKEYLDQIYYAIGNLYLSHKDTTKAIENYVLAAEKSTRGGIDKALAQITLGGLYYDRREYELAQPCYAQAVSVLPENFPDLATLKKRSDVLDELAVYSQNVNLQDSLLRLADMDSIKRVRIIANIINELNRKEREEAEAARREEYEASRQDNESALQSGSNAPQQFNINTDDSWYFYNTQARNSGKMEFQRRWGPRKLEDNWRRRNKASFNVDDFDSDNPEDKDAEQGSGEDGGSGEETMTEEQKEELKRSEDPHYPEYYLKQIPFTPEQKANANDIIQEGLYNMGVILKDKMEDFGAAENSFNRLLTDYPDNVYRLDAYYNLYLMYMRTGDTAQAEKYRRLILSDFADSKYGIALKNPNYIESLRGMEKEQQGLYDKAFEAYMDNDNASVHSIYNDVSTRYPMSKLMPKFMFLEALAYVTERRPDEFNATLRTLLERYPDTDLTPVASAWLKGMAEGRKLNSSSSGNLRGMIWSVSLGNDSTATGSSEGIDFALNPADRQLLVFVFPTDKVNSNELLYNIARHNFRSFVVKDFDLEPMNFGRLGMIAVKDFENLDELNHYRRVMAASSDFKLPAGVRPVVISVPNFDALLRSGGSLDDYFRFLDEQNYKDAQADILPYTEIETLDEAEEAHENRAAEEQAMPSETPEQEATPEQQTAPSDSETVPANPETVPPSSKPSPEPITKPTPKPAQKPASKPEQKTVPKPETKPAPKPTPKPAPKPVYDPGSEGDDDPLLEP